MNVKEFKKLLENADPNALVYVETNNGSITAVTGIYLSDTMIQIETEI